MNQDTLVISSSLKMCKYLKYGFEENQLKAYYTQSFHEGLASYINNNFNLVILDAGSSKPEFCKLLEIMRRSKSVPILVLVQRGRPKERIHYLNKGADVCLPKPVLLEECLAYGNSLIRRFTQLLPSREVSRSILLGNGLAIDLPSRTVMLEGKPVDLTKQEFNLLCYLAQNEGRVISRNQIYELLWEDEYHGSDDGITCQISRLRKKIEKDPEHPRFIKTVRGVGYQME